MNSKKASGYDQITTRSIKENILVLAPVLTELVNMMFRESVFPDCLKVAFKKGSKSNPTNYRPISILPILLKITEKVMSHQIRLYLETHDVLSINQYGFRPGRSTSEAINFLLKIIYTKKLDNSEVAQTIFLDYSRRLTR